MEPITGKSNAQVKNAAALGTSSAQRRQEGLFLLEGARLCGDAALSGVCIKKLFVTPGSRLRYGDTIELLEASAEKSYIIDEGAALRLSDTKTPQGVFCVCKMLDKTADIDKIDYNGRYVALERVADPSNLGSAARTAEAFGLSGLIVCGGCDIYHPPAQRAAMGSLLRLPVLECEDLPLLLKQLGGKGMRTLAAVAHGDATELNGVVFSGGAVCAVGNEGSGLSSETVDACGECVTIRMKGRAESLNASAAAAVIMWEMMK